MNGITVYALGFELDSALSGSTIENILRFNRGLTIELSGSPFKYLHTLLPGTEAELLPSGERIAGHETSAGTMAAIRGAGIKEVRSPGPDRVLLIRLETGTSWGKRGGYVLRLDMTPSAKPAVLFNERDGRITESFGPVRTRIPSSPDELPLQKKHSIVALPDDPPPEISDLAKKDARLETAPEHTRTWEMVKRTSSVLVKNIGGLDPLLARVLSRHAEGEIGRVWPMLVGIGRELEGRRWNWKTYDFPEEGDAGRCAVYPVGLPVKPAVGDAGGFVEALGRRGREVVIPAYVECLKRKAVSNARSEIKRTLRLSENLAKDMNEAERSREYRHLGNLLVTYRHRLKPGMREIRVTDFSGENRVTVPLDPALGPDENIRFYFTRAKKGEKGLLIIKNRRRAVERSLADKRERLEAISRLTSPDELLKILSPVAEAGRRRREKTVPKRFRSYALDERHTVYVGRNNAENDMLTHRFASPGDIWFHAQGVSGSHVILKGATSSTPRTILEKAAAVAAHFSKARHSATVPVVFTEKRYVRKPRKSPAGTAVYERGKTLFVTPSLPDDK